MWCEQVNLKFEVKSQKPVWGLKVICEAYNRNSVNTGWIWMAETNGEKISSIPNFAVTFGGKIGKTLIRAF